ncbi:hypothetical protein [Spiroplasma endosymbiont of Polydrusus cervinus]|uniref:hypothetical protein n=1 Tax=Spiroplasma endosymbiont of Polydrusus cervinus TaxID=3066287 RepID=UPI0030CD4B03
MVFNNKLYFGSDDHNVYEYDPVTEQQKIVMTASNWIRSLGIGVSLNNKLYFGSGDKNVYEYDPVTGQQKIVIRTEGEIWFSGVVFNNKLYFGATDKNVYEYDPVTRKQKIVIIAEGAVQTSGVVFNNKVYFGATDKNVYEYDPVTGQQKVVIRTDGEIHGGGIDFKNKLYFGSDDYNIYEYDPVTGQQKVVMTANEKIRTFGVIFNNKLYFCSGDKNFYEYDPVTGQKRIIFTTDSWNESSGVVFNNKLYFGSADGNVYEYSEYRLDSNLGQINDNSDNAILNELNYLNPDIDISQLEVINKTNTSVTIKSKNKKYFDEFIFNFIIKNKDEVNVINLNELIKKAIFFKFRDENPNLKFKEIKDINTNNLIFSNVEVTKKINSLSKSINKKSICSNKEFINKTTNVRSFNIPVCVYNSKYKLTFQIVIGLINKNNENKLNGWSINYDDEMKLVEFVNPNVSENNEIINELSNNFDLSNINKQEQETVIHYLNESSDKFELNSNEKLQINYSPLIINKYKNILNLKQKVMGTVTAKIVSSSNEEQMVTFSIKEAIQILQNYSLLPDEIIINEDNSITFNGKALISSEIESKIRTDVTISVV